MTRRGLSELGRMLHDDHLGTLAAMNTLEERFLGELKRHWPDVSQGSDRDRLCELIAIIDRDLDQHFRFEEEELFPALRPAGLADVSAMLVQDHEAIRPLASRLRAIAARALDQGFDEATWREFRNAAMDLVPSVMFHIQKEEMCVIQQLGALLDPQADEELARHFGSLRR